jgi:hypothetical protein
MKINEVAKAATAFIVTGYATYQLSTGLDTPAGAGVTSSEWISILVAAFIAGFAVWAVPNTPPVVSSTEYKETFTASK